MVLKDRNVTLWCLKTDLKDKSVVLVLYIVFFTTRPFVLSTIGKIMNVTTKE